MRSLAVAEALESCMEATRLRETAECFSGFRLDGTKSSEKGGTAARQKEDKKRILNKTRSREGRERNGVDSGERGVKYV